MPPSGFKAKAINGLLQFLEGCYEDILTEIEEKGIDPKEAIRQELESIRTYLKTFKIEE